MHYPLRVSSLKERESFYANEFSIKSAESYFRKLPQFFAVDLGTETRIAEESEKARLGKLIILEPNLSLPELKKKLMHYNPEDVYYDRNVYRNPKKCYAEKCFRNCMECNNCLGQQLAFDIDAENFKCPFHNEKKAVCPYCISMSIASGYGLMLFLRDEIGFKDIEIVYSGRGSHVVVNDRKAFLMSMKERTELNKQVEFPIDPWVSSGKSRFLRLPYSLNSLCSRISVPLKANNVFDILADNESIPKFLKKEKIKEFEVARV